MLIGGRYEATGVMNAGGMSEAHVCQDQLLNRKVILKTLKRNSERRRLDDERKALLKLRSNYVVQLMDIVEFTHNSTVYPCLVLEFIDGNNLIESQFDVGSPYLGVIWQIATGLSEIHAQGVVHRDIKPDNIRIDLEGVVKIIDFGLSREANVDNTTRSAWGHIPYMAPELFSPPPITFTAAADVYAFAVVALSILRPGLPTWCRNPVKGVPPHDLIKTHAPGLDDRIEQILLRCLNPNASMRPPITDVVIEIERVLLRDRHRARIVIGGKVSEMHAGARISTPNVASAGTVISSVTIEYTGDEFVVRSLVGEVRANNQILSTGQILPLNCVLAFKYSEQYYYATFDTSNPEYMV